MEGVPCERVFIEGDFLAVAKEFDVKVDVIWIGLNLHHLPHDEKDRFFASITRLLNPGGSFIIFEPMCLEGEDRTAHAKRWWRVCQRKWTVLSRQEMELLRDHIFSADYPETFSATEELARRHCFRAVQSMFRDPDKLYEMVRLSI
jgi:SAM-dependent methyltransferase